MENKIQELTEKLLQDGVEKGKAEAEKIISEAQQKAAQAKVEQETAKVEAETKLIKAQNEAEIKKTEAKGEADANKLISSSITEELIRMKEAEARLKHGWVEVNGASTVVKSK